MTLVRFEKYRMKVAVYKMGPRHSAATSVTSWFLIYTLFQIDTGAIAVNIACRRVQFLSRNAAAPDAYCIDRIRSETAAAIYSASRLEARRNLNNSLKKFEK